MLKYHFPYTEINLDSQTKILLDACFLLALQDEEHEFNKYCDDILNILLRHKCKLFVSNVVIAEVINILVQKFFTIDIGYRSSKIMFNTVDNINRFINNYFNDYEKQIVNNDNKDQFRKINFTKKFNYINKKSNERDLLKVYFEEAVNTINDLEKDLNLAILPINANMVLVAKELSSNYLMGINDAQHLAVSLSHRMDYILTLDGDFDKIPLSKINILAMENLEEIKS